MTTDAFDEVFGDRERILMVFAHPDDMEINCGGLAARLVKAERKVRLICMTAGEGGVRSRSADLKEFSSERLTALREAAAIIGLDSADVYCLGIPDGGVEDTKENIGRVVWHIRSFRPDVVITHNPAGVVHTVDRSYFYVNHRDHRKTATLTVDAVYPFSRDHAFFPEHIASGLHGHAVHDVLFGDAFEDETAVKFEITAEQGRKRSALKVHMDAHAMDAAEFYSYSNEGIIGGRMFETLGWFTRIH